MPNASVAAKLTPVLRPDAPNPIGVCVVCAALFIGRLSAPVLVKDLEWQAARFLACTSPRSRALLFSQYTPHKRPIRGRWCGPKQFGHTSIFWQMISLRGALPHRAVTTLLLPM